MKNTFTFLLSLLSFFPSFFPSYLISFPPSYFPFFLPSFSHAFLFSVFSVEKVAIFFLTPFANLEFWGGGGGGKLQFIFQHKNTFTFLLSLLSFLLPFPPSYFSLLPSFLCKGTEVGDTGFSLCGG